MTLKELRALRARAIEQANAVLEPAEAANRSLNTEEQSVFDGFHNEANTLKARIDNIELQETEQRSLEQSRGRRTQDTPTPTSDELRNWLMAGVPDSGVTASRNYRMPFGETRAMSTSTGSEGGFTVQDEAIRAIEQALVSMGGMREVSQVITTSTGADLPWPLSDNTSVKATILGQNAEAGQSDLEFGQKVLKAHKYVTDIVRVPVELIQDSAVNIAAYVGGQLGNQLARGTNEHFSVGVGVTEPEGAVTGATLGKAGTSATAVTYEELVDLEHSLPAPYRRNAVWMFADSTLRELKKLRDNDGKLIWQQSMRDSEPDRILGYRYQINDDVAPMGSSAKSILFGDFSRYIIRDCAGLHLVRLDERFAEFLQVAFLAYSRHDGLVLDAGTHPIRYLQNAA